MSGASWNRTSDLSIIREVNGIPVIPGASHFRCSREPGKFDRETPWDPTGRAETQLLGQSWD